MFWQLFILSGLGYILGGMPILFCILGFFSQPRARFVWPPWATCATLDHLLRNPHKQKMGYTFSWFPGYRKPLNWILLGVIWLLICDLFVPGGKLCMHPRQEVTCGSCQESLPHVLDRWCVDSPLVTTTCCIQCLPVLPATHPSVRRLPSSGIRFGEARHPGPRSSTHSDICLGIVTIPLLF